MLISRTLLDLDPAVRVKVITIITIDVHGRDVIEKMVQKKINNAGDFMWACQLKFEFNDIEAYGVKRESWRAQDQKTAICKIVDWWQEYS